MWALLGLSVLLLSVTNVNASETCLSMEPLCDGESFPVQVDTTGEEGNNYDCLVTYPNPTWFYLQAGQDGSLGLQITSSAGDVDFAMWGPFDTFEEVYADCGNLPTPVDCSYSTDAVENVLVDNVAAGQYLLLMVTNFENVAGSITVVSTEGSLDCGVLTDDNVIVLPSGTPTISVTPSPSPIIDECPAPQLVASESGLEGDVLTLVVAVPFTYEDLWIRITNPEFTTCTTMIDSNDGVWVAGDLDTNGCVYYTATIPWSTAVATGCSLELKEGDGLAIFAEDIDVDGTIVTGDLRGEPVTRVDSFSLPFDVTIQTELILFTGIHIVESGYVTGIIILPNESGNLVVDDSTHQTIYDTIMAKLLEAYTEDEIEIWSILTLDDGSISVNVRFTGDFQDENFSNFELMTLDTTSDFHTVWFTGDYAASSEYNGYIDPLDFRALMYDAQVNLDIYSLEPSATISIMTSALYPYIITTAEITSMPTDIDWLPDIHPAADVSLECTPGADNCAQFWGFSLSNLNPDACDFNGDYEMTFKVFCQVPDSACDLDAAGSVVYATFTLTGSNYCFADVVQELTTGQISSYEDAERSIPATTFGFDQEIYMEVVFPSDATIFDVVWKKIKIYKDIDCAECTVRNIYNNRVTSTGRQVGYRNNGFSINEAGKWFGWFKFAINDVFLLLFPDIEDPGSFDVWVEVIVTYEFQILGETHYKSETLQAVSRKAARRHRSVQAAGPVKKNMDTQAEDYDQFYEYDYEITDNSVGEILTIEISYDSNGVAVAVTDQSAAYSLTPCYTLFAAILAYFLIR
jgi:hypothetical protein